MRALLADPAFDKLLGGDSRSLSLGVVRGVLARSSGEIEIALTGVVPGVGQPLLVLRAQLEPQQVTTLGNVLHGSPLPGAGGTRRLADDHRTLGGTQTYAMLRADGSQAVGPGEQVELALVGSDLVMTNDTTAMEELLAPREGTSANRRVLSTDRRFLDLQRRIAAPSGSLVIYGDWERLSRRLQSGDENGLPAHLVRWSGLGSARSIMAALSAKPAGAEVARDNDSGGELAGGEFTATLLLDFEREPVDRPRPDMPRPRLDMPGIDGWFASALSVPSSRLVRDLPGGGLGGLVLAVDLRSVASRSVRGADLLRQLRASFEDFGLDFERNVLSRLGERGTMQLLFRQAGEDVAAPTEIESIYSVRARSRTAASDLFTDLRRAAEQHGLGRVVAGRDRPSKSTVDVLELRRTPKDKPVCVAVQGDTVLVAFDAATVDAFLEELRGASKQRGKRQGVVTRIVEKNGGRDVTGLFDLDFTPWFDHFRRLLAAQDAPIDLSGIPSRHVGYLDLLPREGGTLIRICVLSSR
ncbi:MAG: hypothetical protein KDE27_07980 [Planctomycetes bacterium]|nr:hypothetical protein [Planctomycetota bacterium]